MPVLIAVPVTAPINGPSPVTALAAAKAAEVANSGNELSAFFHISVADMPIALPSVARAAVVPRPPKTLVGANPAKASRTVDSDQFKTVVSLTLNGIGRIYAAVVLSVCEDPPPSVSIKLRNPPPYAVPSLLINPEGSLFL